MGYGMHSPSERTAQGLRQALAGQHLRRQLESAARFEPRRTVQGPAGLGTHCTVPTAVPHSLGRKLQALHSAGTIFKLNATQRVHTNWKNKLTICLAEMFCVCDDI